MRGSVHNEGCVHAGLRSRHFVIHRARVVISGQPFRGKELRDPFRMYGSYGDIQLTLMVTDLCITISYDIICCDINDPKHGKKFVACGDK